MSGLVKTGNTWAQKIGRIKAIINPPVAITPIDDTIEIIRDVHIPMRDGNFLSANIYRPKFKGTFPALLSLHPYSKDKLPGKHIPFQYRVIRQTSKITFSAETGWEAPDPMLWVKQGYIVINIDKRGFGKSPGEQEFFTDAEAQDYYDAIEWVAAQSWCTARVGLFGVSYLAISQYKAAAMQPPHLAAICPWEGLSDVYKDAFRPGGIKEDGFIHVWSSGVKKAFGLNFEDEQSKRHLRDEWYQSMIPDLGKIEVPTLICGSFSDQLLHTRGSYRAFAKISSKHKWLYTHRTGKWAAFYSPEALAIQLKFFDYFLKGINNGMTDIPPVRLEVRESRDVISSVRYETIWPLKNTRWTSLFLNGSTQTLSALSPADERELSFEISSESLQFNYEFTEDTEIVGPMKLTLFLQLEKTSDMNLFAGIQKLHNHAPVYFEGSYGFANDIVTKGFLTVSLRMGNETQSTPYDPEHDFILKKLLQPDETAKLEIGLLPSATLFRKGDELRLVIQGQSLLKAGKLDQIGGYENSNSGKCIVLCGGEHQSSLLIPIIS